MSLTVKDAASDDRVLATRLLDGEHTPYHLEDAAQRAALLAKLVDGTMKVISSLSADQDPIFDHTNGTKTTVTTSAAILTPPTGCKFARFASNVDCFIRTDNAAAADDAAAIALYAGQPEIFPVTPGVAVRAFAASSAVIRATPMKARP